MDGVKGRFYAHEIVMQEFQSSVSSSWESGRAGDRSVTIGEVGNS